MSLTFVSGKDNGILLDIGRNMEKLDGWEKLFYEDQKGQRQGRLSKVIDTEYELAKETSERELLEMNEMLQKEEQYARCEDLGISFWVFRRYELYNYFKLNNQPKCQSVRISSKYQVSNYSGCSNGTS